jgi:hypothetical protein
LVQLCQQAEKLNVSIPKIRNMISKLFKNMVNKICSIFKSDDFIGYITDLKRLETFSDFLDVDTIKKLADQKIQQHMEYIVGQPFQSIDLNRLTTLESIGFNIKPILFNLWSKNGFIVDYLSDQDLQLEFVKKLIDVFPNQSNQLLIEFYRSILKSAPHQAKQMEIYHILWYKDKIDRNYQNNFKDIIFQLTKPFDISSKLRVNCDIISKVSDYILKCFTRNDDQMKNIQQQLIDIQQERITKLEQNVESLKLNNDNLISKILQFKQVNNHQVSSTIEQTITTSGPVSSSTKLASLSNSSISSDDNIEIICDNIETIVPVSFDLIAELNNGITWVDDRTNFSIKPQVSEKLT